MTHQESDSAANNPIARRLQRLRETMSARGLDCYLVPSADEHQNEYTPPYKRRREAISGFGGSAGDVAVCLQAVHLFVDSRYHLQAEQETDPRLYQVHKLGLEGELDLYAWLREAQPKRVGLDPFVFSLNAYERLEQTLLKWKGEAVPIDGNLVDPVWESRPTKPHREVYLLPDSLTGETTAEKLVRIRKAMEDRRAHALILSRLDEVAWTLNCRGADIPYNPVFEGYLLVSEDRATCFTDAPLGPGVAQGLADSVVFRPLEAFPEAVRSAAAATLSTRTLWLDREGSSRGVRALAKAAQLELAPNPVVAMKAAKNSVEVVSIRDAHLAAATAKVRSFSLLFAQLAEGVPVSEAGYGRLLEAEYAREDGYVDLSFTTITAYGAHGAIIHYATPDPATDLAPGGLLLVDSGIQLRGATTDDTRTIAIGEPTEEQRLRYTDVLRGHIRLAMQIFPEGTSGQQLDVLARGALWNEGLDYGHGTGHGVGAFLNVHEGPQNISSRGVVPLEPGNVLSNEPGYYRAGWGGVRLENLYVVEEALGFAPHPSGKRWLRFSPLTLIPFDTNLIDWERLTAEEQQWLLGYHRLVWQEISPRLEDPHRAWLRVACQLPGFSP